MRHTVRSARRRSALVGLVVLVVAAVAGVIAAASGGQGRPITVTAQFEDAVGLYQGNSVAVLGMPVGTVSSVVPEDNYVEVKLAIDRGVDIPAGAEAVTVSTSLLTDRHVELTPAYRGGPKLKNGDVLSLSRTRTPVEFDRTLAMVDKLARSLGGDGAGRGPMADLVGIGTRITTGSGQEIKTALDQLSEALRLGADHGAGTQKNIQTIANSLADLTQAAANNDSAIREFGSDLRQLSDIIGGENLGAGDTGRKLIQILDEATSLLEQNRDRLKGTVADFGTLTRALTDYRREMAETIDVLPMLAGNIYNIVDQKAGAMRAHALTDKFMADSQLNKEVCNLAAIHDLGCATGTIGDYSADFGASFFVDSMTGLLENMAGARK